MKRYFVPIFLALLFFCSSNLDARGGSFSSGSRSFSSGSSSRSFSSGSNSRGFSSGSSGSSSSSSSRSFSSGSSSSTVKPASTPSRSFDSKASTAASKQESKSSFIKSNSSTAPVYKPTMSQPTIQENKRQVFYQTYYTNPRYVREVHHYHYRDSYNPYFMLWLLDRSADERALWAYHHRSDMDDARYRELLSRDSDLDKRLHGLEAQGVLQDPKYKPKGVDDDLMYNSDSEMKKDKIESSNGVIKSALIASLVFLLIGISVWSVFFKRWNV